VTRFLAPAPEAPVAPGPAPTFSVAIAVHDAADVVGEAIESALGQTRPPLEVVVCDDGSTDDLDAALEPYRDRIVLVRKEQGGEGSAKNAAARAASGEFVVILDADDVFHPRRLEALAELASARPDLDILTSDAVIAVDGRPVRRCYSGGWTFPVEDQRTEILRRNFVFGLAAVRREALLRDGGFDEGILWTTDWDRWLRLILAGSRVGAVAEPLATYRVRETSLSARREDLTRGKVATLEKARATQALSAAEHAALEEALTGYRRELALAELRRGLAAGDPAVRRHAAALSRARGLTLRQRVEVAAARAAPRAAGRAVRARTRRFWTGAGGTRVDRRAAGTAATRIMLHTDARAWGGAERSLANLAAELSPRFEVVVAGVDRGVVEAVAAGRPGARTAVVPFIARRSDLRAVAAHLRALLAVRPRVLHVNLHSPWTSQMLLFLAPLLPGLRVVAVEQLPSPASSEGQRRIKRGASRRLAAHVAVGERSAREVERLAGLPAGSVRVIHNGVPDVAADLARARSAGAPTVGSMGRLEPQKGFDVLLRALPSLPGTRAVLVGDGGERAALERLAAELGLDGRVAFTGWSEDARAQLASFDVFVLPSRYEGFPLAVVEAMLAGRPVVASDVGSVREAVRDGATGLLVPPNDPGALAAAVGRLLADPGRAREMGRAGRRLALERYTAGSMARSFECLYDEILT
jgi:glycosyltransferase involved in cell wall biosynthesis